ncbi:MAG TPA: hypothetical protein VFW17_06815 [Ktedonobacterales bacterium]|nr:hypothetical protein [Ktedonobacterales bacterium]
MAAVGIGKIVGSESHVRYTCQIFGPGEVAAPPDPSAYAFGGFVRLPLRTALAAPDVAALEPRPSAAMRSDALMPAPAQPLWAVGFIYDTILVNPAFGTLGPRLSNDEQLAIFSPDYLAERAVLVSILVLGTMSGEGAPMGQVTHGVPALAPDLGAVVEPLTEAQVRAFHTFADTPQARPYLHLGYLPHTVAQDHPLLPLAMLRTVERLETLLPENASLLAIVKRNLAWRLKVLAAG